ncbi:MAG: flavodoxin-dependent (E)-4-hydroxy-3-methylbut-2-enyl-diphosphate synthase [Candidatus Omnitrophota bacterium]
MIKRRKTRLIMVGNVAIGSARKIIIQSMAKTDTADIATTIKQIREVEKVKGELIRVAVKDQSSAKAIGEIKSAIGIPLIADIHFDYRLALTAIASGVDKIRLNPGNIYKEKEVASIAAAAKERNIPIRVGVNSGSLRKESSVTVNSLVSSALAYIKLLEKYRFYDIVVSLKSSDIFQTVQANKKIASIIDYPLHLGVTATGFADIGFVKSAICLGMLLSDGIGDTIRVSLTAHPCEEVIAAKKILAALDINNPIELIACPTCGRCQVDLTGMVSDLEVVIKHLDLNKLAAGPLKVAIMGCVVNGPGEARWADLGLAFGKDYGLFFKKGKPIKKVNQKQAVRFLITEIRKTLKPTH